MFTDLINIIFPNGSPWVDDIQTWIDTLVSTYNLTNIDLGCTLIPWDNICATIVLCVFIICLFKFMRSVFCKVM